MVIIYLLPPLPPPFSLIAPPLLVLFLTPLPSHPLSLMYPADNMRFTIIITLITLSLLSTPISLLFNEEIVGHLAEASVS